MSQRSPRKTSATVPVAPPSPPRYLLSVADLMHELRMSRAQVYRLFATELATLHIGKRRYVLTSEFERFLASHSEDGGKVA